MSRTRILAAAIMAPAAIASILWLPSPLLAGLVAGLMMLGLWEWTRLVGLEDRPSRAGYLLANAVLMAALVWGAGQGLFLFKLVSVIGAAWWLAAALWLAKFDFAAIDTAWTRALKLLAGSLSTIPAWAALGWLHAAPSDGPRWALFAIAIVWAADSGAYFVGIRFGKRKLAPRISPGKSWEGLVGGMVCALLLALAAFPLLGLGAAELPALLALALATAAISVVGDLFESLLKRHANIKDSGDLIPGHGGVLDRIDGLLAALPIFVLGKLWLNL
jgi:phosphatidate cytidylyltransferase